MINQTSTKQITWLGRMFLALMFLLGVTNVHAQTTSTIGTVGALSSYFYGPIYRSSATSVFHYSNYAYIYTQAELAAAGINPGDAVSDIRFYKNSTFQMSGTNSGTVTIYAKNSANTALTSPTTWGTLTSGATLVNTTTYNSTSNIPGAVGWVTYTFSAPFTYTGGALEIYVGWSLSPTTSPYTGGAFNWLYASGYSGNMSLGYASNLASTGTTNLATGSYGGTLRPNTQLTTAPSGPCTGTPAPGNTTGPSAVCPGQTFSLGLQNSTPGSGVTYLWESADDAAFTLNVNTIPGSLPSVSTSQTSDKYYRCLVDCGGNSAYSNVLTVTTNGFLGCYCIPTTTNGCASGDHITNVTFTSSGSPINNTTGACLSASYSNYTAQQATVMQGDIVPVSVSVNNGGTEYAAGWIDYDQSGTFDASEYIALTDADGVAPWIYTANVTIPVTATVGITGMRFRSSYAATIAPNSACGTYSFGETEDYRIDIMATTACTGTPAPGNTIASAASVCPGGTVNLSLQNVTPGTGVTYQWESADDAAFTLNVQTLGTSPFQSANPTTATYYRCLVDCGGNSAYSTEVLVNINSFLLCYACTPIPAFAADEEIYSVTVGAGSTDPLYAGAAGCTTVAPGPGSILNRYSNFKTLAPITSVMQGDIVPFTVEENECDGATFYSFGTGIWIDYNQDGDFDDVGEEAFKEGTTLVGPRNVTGTFTVPFTALTGTTVMRVIVAENFAGATLTPCLAYNYGETEEFLIDITPSTACTGTPSPGNTIASAASVCPGSPVNLSLQNQTIGSGVTYQWESADDAAFTLNVQTLGTSPFQTANPTTPTYYRCLVDCGGNSAYSVEVLVGISPFLNCYCSTGLGGSCGINAMSSVEIVTTTLNNVTNGCTGPYNAFPQSGSTTASLLAGNPYTMNVGVITGSNTQVAIWIDYNQNGTFETSEYTLINGNIPSGGLGSGSFTIPLTALAGSTGMRVRSDWQGTTAWTSADACTNRTWGETEDYIIDIVLPSACSGTPAPGNTVASVASVCPGGSVNLSLQNPNLGTGITYQWESADDAAFTINVQTLGTASTQSATLTTPTYYRCLVDCGGNTAYSVEVLVNINSFLDCYCTSIPGFAGDEEIYSVTIGSGSTDALYAGVAGCTTAAPGPGSILGRYSNFKTLSPITSVMQGDIVPFTVEENECDGATFFSFGTGIWIDYNHDGDYDDAGEEVFKEATTLVGPRNVTGNFTVPFTSTLGTTTMRVIVAENFSGASLTPCLTYNYGETEDFLIDITASTACTGTPTPGNTIASATTFCAPASPITLSLQNATTGSGVTYQWYQANDQAFTSGVVALGTSNTQSVTPSQASTWYRCEVTCSGNTGISTEVEITQNAPSACYCTPTYSTGTGFGDYIQTAEILGTTLNNNSGASPSPYYTLYPQSGSTTAALAPGTTYTLNVTVGTYSANDVAAWIDYNGNGVLNDLTPDVELLGEAYNVAANGVASIVFTVPASLPLGDYRLRIREADQSGVMDPCLGYSYGETEDYTISVVNPTASLLATFVIQGYYDVNTGNMQPVYLNSGVGVSPTEADLVTVSLHDASAPYAQVHTFSGIQNINGQITCTFPGSAVGNSYYIVLTNRNAVETWSANPVLISASTSYDFTSSAAQAYLGNQIDVSGTGLFAIYNGDVNQDDVIDGLDFNDWETDNNNFAGGYVTTDFNGDGIVDGLDFLIWEPNNNNFIGTAMP